MRAKDSRPTQVHELAIAESIVSLVCEALGNQKVITVTIEIGALSGISTDALRFALPVVAEGSLAQNAGFELVEAPGRAACEDCGREFAVQWLHMPCACGSSRTTIVAGQDLLLKSIEVEEQPENV